MDNPDVPRIDDQIAALARKFWEEEGEPDGRAEEHWRRAEEQLRAQRRPQEQDADGEG